MPASVGEATGLPGTHCFVQSKVDLSGGHSVATSQPVGLPTDVFLRCTSSSVSRCSARFSCHCCQVKQTFLPPSREPSWSSRSQIIRLGSFDLLVAAACWPGAVACALTGTAIAAINNAVNVLNILLDTFAGVEGDRLS